MSKNEAAERLRADAKKAEWFTSAIAAARRDERRATVERIRERLNTIPVGTCGPEIVPAIARVLDEEAAR